MRCLLTRSSRISFVKNSTLRSGRFVFDAPLRCLTSSQRLSITLGTDPIDIVTQRDLDYILVWRNSHFLCSYRQLELKKKRSDPLLTIHETHPPPAGGASKVTPHATAEIILSLAGCFITTTHALSTPHALEECNRPGRWSCRPYPSEYHDKSR